MKRKSLIILMILQAFISAGLGQYKLKDIYHAKEPEQKEQMYRKWMKEFPPDKSDSANRIQYDYARYDIAINYAKKNNISKALYYSKLLESPLWKSEGWAGIAQVLVKSRHLSAAMQLYIKARAYANLYLQTHDNDNDAKIIASRYLGYSMELGRLYIKQKKYKEALPVVQQVYETSESADADVYQAYASILQQLSRNNEALRVLENAVTHGLAHQLMKDDLRKLYIKVNGSEAGYDNYVAALNKTMAEHIKTKLAKDILDVPATDFTLTDLDGNSISLNMLKGKTVILDFWATWCGPCKSSFPAMKKAMEQFNNNPDVSFFFIHTWEKDNDASALAKKYVTDNHYPFIVLMDLKNKEGINPVAEAFQLGGLPTKIIIDSNGNIRFKLTGFSGGEEATVQELTAMIELCKIPA